MRKPCQWARHLTILNIFFVPATPRFSPLVLHAYPRRCRFSPLPLTRRSYLSALPVARADALAATPSLSAPLSRR
jgi:hypothetical protein